MTSSEQVTIRLSLTGAAEAARDMDRVTEAERRMGATTQTTMGQVTQSTDRARESRGRYLRTSEQGHQQGQRQGRESITTTDRVSLSAQRAMNMVERGASAAGRVTATAFTAAVTTVGALAVTAARTGVSYNVLQQQARAALTTLLGGAQAANAQMDKLDVFARTSPFAKDVFIKAQQQMIGFGISAEKVIPYLTAIQDATAASGGTNTDLAGIASIMAGIQSSAKITGTDLMQLGNYGLDAATLIGSSMGQTGGQIRDAITGGKLPYTVALDALAIGMEKRFGGAAAGVKATMVGAFDRIKAAGRDLGGEIARPFVDPNGGGKAIGWANSLADLIRALTAKFGPVWQGMFANGVPAIDRALARAKDFITSLSSGQVSKFINDFKQFAPVIAGIGTALTIFGGSDIPILGTFLKGINPLVAGLLAAAAASPELRAALGDLWDAFKPLIPAISDVASLVADKLSGAVEVVAHSLSNFASWVSDNPWFLNLAEVIGGVAIAWWGFTKVIALSKFVFASHPIIAIAAALALIVTNWDKVEQLASKFSQAGHKAFGTIEEGTAVAAPGYRPGHANGTVLPGYAPGMDSIPAMLSPGEGVLVPEVTKALGADTINSWNNWGVSRRKFAFGGIAGSTPTITPTGNAALAAALQQASMKSVFAATAAGSNPAAIAAAATGAAVGAVISAMPAGNDPVGRWKGVATQALQLTGQYSESNLASMMQRLKWESSGNPQAINKSDRNWRNGTPSKGLWQVIDPTFKTYAQPGYDKNIYDPLSNALASINYAVKTYGTLEKAYGRKNSDGSVAGYDSGGWLPPGGGMGMNMLAKPEPVLTPDQWDTARGSMEAIRRDGSAGGDTYHVTFNIDGSRDIDSVMAAIQDQWDTLAERGRRRERTRSLTHA